MLKLNSMLQDSGFRPLSLFICLAMSRLGDSSAVRQKTDHDASAVLKVADSFRRAGLKPGDRSGPKVRRDSSRMGM